MLRSSSVALEVVALAIFVTQILGFSLAIPAGEGPDEWPHLRYAAHLELHGLPGPEVELVQAQHPPAYHALIGSLYGQIRAHGEALVPPDGPDLLRVPFLHRRVEIPWAARIPDPLEAGVEVARGAAPAPPPAAVPIATVHLLRSSGLVLGLITALLALRSARSFAPGGRTNATLALVALLVSPQLAASFATINNDQMAILAATAGVAALVGALRRGRLDDPRALLVAGAFFALGLASKLMVIGGLAVGLVIALGAGGSLLARLRRGALLGLPLLLPAAWVATRLLSEGSLNAVEKAASAFPFLLRRSPPDFPMGYVEIVGGLLESGLGEIGSERVTAGVAWRALALLLPTLVVLATLAAAVSRRIPAPQRLVARAFALGLAVQLTAVLLGNRHFAYVHGRYLLVLVLPAALTLAAGAPLLFGRTRMVLRFAAVWMALGGLLLLHGRVLPTYHSGGQIQSLPGLVHYADLGRGPLDAEALDVVRHAERSQWAPRPRGRSLLAVSGRGPVLHDFSVPAERVPPLPAEAAALATEAPDALLVASAWWQPVGETAARVRIASADLLAEGAPVCGPISPCCPVGWRSWPIPRSASRDGQIQLIMRLLRGPAAGLAEVVVRRLPLRALSVQREGGEVVARFWQDEDGPALPPLALQLQTAWPERRRLGEPAPLPPRTGSGLREARLVVPEEAEGALEVALLLPEALWCDHKLVHHRVEGARTASSLRSPGYFHLEIPARDPEGGARPVARIPLSRWPRGGDYRVELLDDRGRRVSERFQLRLPAAREEGAPVVVKTENETFLVTRQRAARPGEEVEILALPGPSVRLDRLRATTRRGYVFPVR